MEKKGKLELTWVGKYEEEKLEPRILIEDKSKSYGDQDTENMLIHGDNLLALKALEKDYSGKVKCIYIDPPYNTGNAFDMYDDDIEHSIWLDLFYKRICILKQLLADDGFIFVNLDEVEHAYAKIILDEVFGRENYIGDLIWQKRKGGGNDSRYLALDHDYILVYGKKLINNNSLKRWRVAQTDEYLKRYKETDENGNHYYWDTLARNGLKNPIPISITCPDGSIINFNSQKSLETINEGLRTGMIKISKGKNGWSLHHRVYMKEGQVQRSILNDVGTNKSANDEIAELFGDSKSFPYPKPEKLIMRILELCTSEGDLVLDSFLGSGTTAAVAHKMNRRYIGIELENHCYTHCKTRLDKVINGEQGGISKDVNWQGGGGYKFYELAEPLLVKNSILPIYQLNPSYTWDMVCEAICKIEGFTYSPLGEFHGYSSENRFIHITEEFVNTKYVMSVMKALGERQSLMIYCKKNQADMMLPENVEIKKIPKDLLDKCNFESEVQE